MTVLVKIIRIRKKVDGVLRLFCEMYYSSKYVPEDPYLSAIHVAALVSGYYFRAPLSIPSPKSSRKKKAWNFLISCLYMKILAFSSHWNLVSKAVGVWGIFFNMTQSDIAKPTRLSPSKAYRLPGTSRIDGIQNLNCIERRLRCIPNTAGARFSWLWPLSTGFETYMTYISTKLEGGRRRRASGSQLCLYQTF